ncbi:MAG: hypothetical protein M1368_01810 [Thaumarchaeota archaeon]|nr:hypothetical protein [Nitrososphaerota archaeon]
MGHGRDVRVQTGLMGATYFHNMVANERSFDRLFCDVICYKYYCAYYNKEFTEDPIFNHIVLEDALSVVPHPDSTFEQVLSDSSLTATRLKIPVSIFVDKHLPWSGRFAQIAIDRDFRIAEKMNILAKGVAEVSATANDKIRVATTRNVELWNDTFIRAYSIPNAWNAIL